MSYVHLVRDLVRTLRESVAASGKPTRRVSTDSRSLVAALESRVLLSANALKLVSDATQTASPKQMDEVRPGVFIERQNWKESPSAQSLLVQSVAPQLNGNGLQFNLIPAAGMDPRAIAGFQQAANFWSATLRDDIIMNLSIGFSSLGAGILGQTGSATQENTFAAYRSALIGDATSADDAIATANLPAGPTLSLYTSNTAAGGSAGAPAIDNNGSNNNRTLTLSTALAKAVGLRAAGDTGVDASITFSSDFSFDFDRTNGIDADKLDFVGIAIHEIGHALGFTSGADTVDFYSGQGPRAGTLNLDNEAIVEPLDLFRRSTASESNGADIDLRADTADKYFSIDGGATNLAPFSTGVYNGDGRQASHWKDNLGIGIMDPTAVGPGQLNVFTTMDGRAFDVIGWNLASAANGPEISVTSNGTDIGDGTGSVAFGTVDQDALNNTSVTRTFIVTNVGNQNLTLQPARFTSGTGFTIISPNFTAGQVVTPGSSATLTVRMDSLRIGAKTATISFVNNDSNENPFNFTLTGTVAAVVLAPEIAVSLGTTDIPDGTGVVSFGMVRPGAAAVSRTLTITNTGNANLTLQPARFTTGSGFVLTSANFTPGQVVAAGSSVQLTVRMDTAVAGVKTATLSFVNNDSNENPFDMTLTGNVNASASTIGGKVFNDLDGDGVLDLGELGIGGRTVFIDANNNRVLDGPTTVSTSVTSTNVPVAIPTIGTVSSTINVTGLSGVLSDMNVTVNLTHSFDSDLTLTLIAPDGTQVLLVQNRGGSGDNFAGTIFDDGATVPIALGSAPFTGSFQPETPLSVLNGLSPNGTWTLRINDGTSGDSGTLTSWSLNLARPVAAEMSTITNASGDYTFDTLLAGTYTIRQVLPINAGWTQTAPAANGAQVINLANAQTYTGANFGARQQLVPNGTIVDDGDAGFSVTGPWTIGVGGFANDFRQAAAGAGTATATYTFTGLTAGTYRIDASWIAGTDRANNVPYAVRGTAGGAILTTFAQNQQLAPNSFVNGGIPFKTLGTVTITGTTLVVTVSNTVNGVAIADAIRIEPIPNSTNFTIDDGDAGFSVNNPGLWTTAVGGFGTDYRQAAAGAGTATATYTFTGLTAGMYRIDASWVAGNDRANNVPYVARGAVGGPVLSTFTLNQRNTSGSYQDGSIPFQILGTVTITGSTLVVTVSNTTTGIVTADAIRIQRIPSTVMTIDNSAPGFSMNNPSLWSSTTGGLGNNSVTALAGAGTATATYNFTGLVAGTYQIAASWISGVNRATNVPYAVRNTLAGPVISTLTGNQKAAPNSFTDGGVQFQILGTVTITGTSMVITLSNTMAGQVNADAIRIQRIG